MLSGGRVSGDRSELSRADRFDLGLPGDEYAGRPVFTFIDMDTRYPECRGRNRRCCIGVDAFWNGAKMTTVLLYIASAVAGLAITVMVILAVITVGEDR